MPTATWRYRPIEAIGGDRVGTLDGVRSVAAFAVLYSHLPHQNLWLLPGSFLPGGVTAVYAFFALSGFLITRILLRTKAANGSLGRFYARRSLRIFPIYYLLILIIYVTGHHGDWIWPALTYTINFHFQWSSPINHAWSLAIEEQFYLVWPPLVWLLPRAPLRKLVIVAIFGWMAATMALGWFDYDWLLEQNAFRPIPLLCGCWMAFDERELREWPIRAMIIASIFIVLGYFGPQIHAERFLMAENFRVFDEFFGVGVVLLAIALNSYPGPIRWLLGSPPLAGLAAISYGMYLYHLPLYAALGDKVPGRTFSPPLAVAVTIAVAAASYFLIERPLLSLAPGSGGKKSLMPQFSERAVISPSTPSSDLHSESVGEATVKSS